MGLVLRNTTPSFWFNFRRFDALKLNVIFHKWYNFAAISSKLYLDLSSSAPGTLLVGTDGVGMQGDPRHLWEATKELFGKGRRYHVKKIFHKLNKYDAAFSRALVQMNSWCQEISLCLQNLKNSQSLEESQLHANIYMDLTSQLTQTIDIDQR